MELASLIINQKRKLEIQNKAVIDTLSEIKLATDLGAPTNVLSSLKVKLTRQQATAQTTRAYLNVLEESPTGSPRGKK